MARFTSDHPLQFTEPAASFVANGGEFAFETGDAKVADRLRAVAATYGLREAPADDLDSRTVDDLKGYAAEYGVDLTGKTLKADIVAAIRAHFASVGEPVETPVTDLPPDSPALVESQPVAPVEDAPQAPSA